VDEVGILHPVPTLIYKLSNSNRDSLVSDTCWSDIVFSCPSLLVCFLFCLE